MFSSQPRDVTCGKEMLCVAVALSATLCVALKTDSSASLASLVDQSGGTRRCEIGETPRGRGLIATADVGPNEVALRIPKALALVEPDVGTSHWAGRMAMRILERGDDDYSRCLPPPPWTPARGDWPEALLEEFQDEKFEANVDAAYFWRHEQAAVHCQSDDFLDALDLVSSRTIRVGDQLLLVPYLDMANHASADEGGGYYAYDDSRDEICLVTGNRKVCRGEEVLLDYGDRANADWIIHYGFLPNRNTADKVLLPDTRRTISWQDLPLTYADPSVREECQAFLAKAPTTVPHDLELLRRHRGDERFTLAVRYRIQRKILVAAAAGVQASRADTSAFSPQDKL